MTNMEINLEVTNEYILSRYDDGRYRIYDFDGSVFLSPGNFDALTLQSPIGQKMRSYLVQLIKDIDRISLYKANASWIIPLVNETKQLLAKIAEIERTK